MKYPQRFLKYALYQAAVQDPSADAALYEGLYEKVRGSKPRILREDFCAAFAFSCAWVKRHPSNLALCLDIDEEPLSYGRKYNYSSLNAQEKKRLSILKQDVVSVTSPKADLIVAGNFSFCYLKKRTHIVDYFKKALSSLKPGGLLFLEIAGGSEFVQKGREQRKVSSDNFGQFTYYWEHKTFDPVNRDAKYSIHFKLKNGQYLRDAFTYEWRLWTIPEIREAMLDAGFKKTHVFWEKHVRGHETGEYELVEQAKNREFWLAYAVGER